MEIGRVYLKTAGRESGTKCVVVELVDENFVLIDGVSVKRRKCNVRHLVPTDVVLDLKSGAKTKDIEKAFKDAKLEA